MARQRSRSSAKPTSPRKARLARLGHALQCAFLLSTFVVIVHFNVVRPYLLGGADIKTATADAPAWLRAPVPVYDTVLEAGRRLGLSLTWRMYSPVPRDLRMTEWSAQDASGRWVPVSAPDLTLSYRRDRSLADALLWDFKRARIHDNYFVHGAGNELPWIYVRASRDQIVRELGFVPQALRVVVRTAPIPAPAEKGDWQPGSAVFETVVWEQVYR